MECHAHQFHPAMRSWICGLLSADIQHTFP